ncbi:hypothetical protein [Asanoa iriomotensis]|nr:hypothetical protein [Asanoa iriomotensis]
MDLDCRDRLLRRIGDINDFDRPRPLVTIAEFFDGNDDPASIGYNLPAGPTPDQFHTLLSGIAGRPEVADVRIEVKDLENPDGWPATDTIWIITTASPETVRAWFPDHLAPDDLGVGLSNSVEPFQPPPGTHAVWAWYD